MAIATTTRHVELTCALDRHAHLVADGALAAALVAEQGTFPALCGHVVAASSLSAPDGRPCPRCVMAAGKGTSRGRRGRRGRRR